MRTTVLLVCLALACPALPGCGEAPAVEHDAGTAVAARREPEATEPTATPEARSPEARGPVITIGGGSLRAGSAPGTPGRRPTREADDVPLAMPEVRIDRLPYPGEPLQPPTLVSTRREAQQLCASRGARLCTELEWERACAGDDDRVYPGGASFDADACSLDPGACATDHGMLRMGITQPEWTASDLEPHLVRGGRTAIVRGARLDQPATAHRCASRGDALPEGTTPMAFRCCHGEAPALAYPRVDDTPPFADRALERDALRAALAQIPELQRYAADFEPLDRDDAVRALGRGHVDETALAGWQLAVAPFQWSPVPGDVTWVIAGHSGEDTVLAVLYELADGSLAHAGSLIIEGERAPLAIARDPATRDQLQWSTCWGCIGEGGDVRFGEDAIIRVLTR